MLKVEDPENFLRLLRWQMRDHGVPAEPCPMTPDEAFAMLVRVGAHLQSVPDDAFDPYQMVPASQPPLDSITTADLERLQRDVEAMRRACTCNMIGEHKPWCPAR